MLAMRRYIPLTTLLVAAFFLAACAETETETETVDVAEPEESVVTQASWNYEDETGPDSWAELSEDYAVCEAGTEQSPVALQTRSVEEAELPALSFDYGQADLDVKDTGLGYKALPTGEHTLTMGDETYELLQFHAHAPSEHTLDGETYPMEVHFVHQNDAGELAVVGVMIEEDGENAAYSPVISAIRGSADATVERLGVLFPEGSDYFTYEGSLTTPPCTEGVRWIVMEELVALSPEQVDTFEDVHGETNRPVQSLEDREVRVSAS